MAWKDRSAEVTAASRRGKEERRGGAWHVLLSRSINTRSVELLLAYFETSFFAQGSRKKLSKLSKMAKFGAKARRLYLFNPV